ncbi:MAG: ATP-grasp domain-containing protein [Planctomycetota bacterium]
MNVLMLSPGFPEDMPYFTRGLAIAGARVFGVGDQPKAALKPEVRDALTDYLQVRSLWKIDEVVKEIRGFLRNRSIDRVETLWEPAMLIAARLRELLGCPGLNVEQTEPFRDKVLMKDRLDQAGIRTPYHFRATTRDEVHRAVDKIGFPLILKPVDGAGSADTFRCDDSDDLDKALRATAGLTQLNVEEFIEGEEFTYDTVTSKGDILFDNIAWYRPKPLVTRNNPWISQQVIVFRDLEVEALQTGRELGRKVVRALGFESGFTHMEWFLKGDGEAVFGEIGGRAPGGRLTHVMNHSNESDLFNGWGEAIVHGRMSQPITRRYNAAAVFKRAEGTGRIASIDGLQSLMHRFGDLVSHIDLVPVGEPRRDYRQIVTGDGWLVVRHPDLQTTIEAAEAFANELRMTAQ